MHMAAKIEEIYPPHINAFIESTNNSVSQAQMAEQEIKLCWSLGWNFDSFVSCYEWASWFMYRWDAYVDSTLAYLKNDFDLKFYGSESTSKYAIVMQFVDALAMHEKL